MARVVCKFGGSSLATYEKFKKVRNIIESNPDRKIIVPSAPGKSDPKETKITDLLYGCYELASKNLDFSVPFATIRDKYLGIEQDLNLNCEMESRLSEVKEKIEHGASRDLAASRGEYLCGILLAEFLNGEMVDPEEYVLFDQYGKISPDTYTMLGERMSDSDKTYVMPGFYGKDHFGKVKTFSRGGSDISGAIAARAVKAELYENWTDVSGLLMADPNIVSNPRQMDIVTYREIRELAYMGAKVFHDDAIAPVRELNIPIQIRNTEDPGDPGTKIVGELATTGKVVAGIAGKKHASIFNIEKAMMNKERGFGRKVLGIFESHEVSYEHSPTGIDSMSVVVLQEELGDKAGAICDTIQRVMQPDNVSVHHDLSLIATVGEGMQQNIGTAARLFSALSEEKINVRVIDQGSSEVNIIVGVQSDDYEKAINALYRCFVG
jgi:aspartate kinase